jgi:hypothetical protein
VTTKLVIDRAGMKWASRFVKLRVLLDGERVATLKYGETAEIPMENGNHIIEVKLAGQGGMAGGSSTPHKLHVADHEEIRLHCGYRRFGGSPQIWSEG